MLLQSLQLLDIDKLIEHRPPLDGLTFWKRPAIPQLTIGNPPLDKYRCLKFEPLRCSSCSSIIRGSMFLKDSENAAQVEKNIESAICEDCYREKEYGSKDYHKNYKHCILADVLTPNISHSLCVCVDVPKFDKQGRPRELYPLNKEDKHVKTSGMSCGLMRLKRDVAEAKYDGMQTILGAASSLKGGTMKDEKGKKGKKGEKYIEKSGLRKVREEEALQNLKPREDSSENGSKTSLLSRTISRSKPKKSSIVEATERTLNDPNERDAVEGMTHMVEEAEADSDIPFFIRKYTERYPFGNVHMALRLGPLVFENGVAQYAFFTYVACLEKTNLPIVLKAELSSLSMPLLNSNPGCKAAKVIPSACLR